MKVERSVLKPNIAGSGDSFVVSYVTFALMHDAVEGILVVHGNVTKC